MFDTNKFDKMRKKIFFHKKTFTKMLRILRKNCVKKIFTQKIFVKKIFTQKIFVKKIV